MNPLSIGPEDGTAPEFRGGVPERGIGWRGIEAKEVELSNAEARSRLQLQEYGSRRAVERGVAVLALRDAPEMEQNVVVWKYSVWTLEEEMRHGSGRM